MSEPNGMPVFRRLRTPSGTPVCVSSRGKQITIAVGARQRINCDHEEAHAVWRALTTELFSDGATAPAWTMRIPEVSHR
jgi:hypothetical protein